MTDVTPGSVLKRIQTVLRESSQLNLKYEVANQPVPGQQLSIIFCETQDPWDPLSIVKFDVSDRNPRGNYLPDAKFPLREHLLFLQYSPLTRELVVLGDLSYSEFQEILNEEYDRYVSIAHIVHDGNSLVYRDNEWEVKFLSELDQFTDYMGFNDADPDAVFPELNIEQRTDLLYDSFTEVVFGLQDIKTLQREQLYDRLISRQFDVTRRDAKFYYGCLLAAMSPNFQLEFQASEIAKLSQLFSLIFNTEAKRIAFCKLWCPGIEIVRPLSPSQFYNLPNQCVGRLVNSDLEWLQQRHATHYPNCPNPGVYFRTSVLNAPALLADLGLPVSRGMVNFTHYELFQFVESQILKRITIQVNHIREKNNLFLTERFLAPLICQRQFYGSSKADMRKMLVEQYKDEKEVFFDDLMTVFSELLDRPKPSLLRDAAVPLIAGLSNCMGLEDSFPVWPLKRTLDYTDEELYEQHPELKSLHQEIMPTTYEDLLELSQRYWPPCMQRLAANRVGGNHMQHTDRVRMAALIRTFGYTKQQGFELWHRLFERTQSYPGFNKFLKSPAGLVIEYDYKKNKLIDIGVSCRALIPNFCPFSIGRKPGEVRDIEETACKAQCKAQFIQQNPGWNMPYPLVKSPRHYFFQARDAYRLED